MAERVSSSVRGEVTEPTLEAWGRAVGKAAARGELWLPLVIALRGPLGAGKSVLARAIARGAGVEGPMPSPTYNLVFSYTADTDTGTADTDTGTADTDTGTAGHARRTRAGGRSGGEGEPLWVHHLDLYRLEDPEDVWELGWQELGEGRELVLIEWPERAEALLPPDRWEVELELLHDPGAAHLRSLRVELRGGVPDPPALDVVGFSVDTSGDGHAGAGE